MVVQVLSDSVAVALHQLMEDEASDTSKLCEMMSKFFDCLDVRSVTEHKHRNNANVKPYANEMMNDWTGFLLPKHVEKRHSTKGQ